MTATLDSDKLEQEVKDVYRTVASELTSEFHFEMRRKSFAGIGYHFDFAALEDGDDVLGMESESRTDVFDVALHDGDAGSVTGLFTTDEHLEKARQLPTRRNISLDARNR